MFLFTDSAASSSQHISQLYNAETVFSNTIRECDKQYEAAAKGSFFSMFNKPASLVKTIESGAHPQSNDRHAKPFQFAVQYALAQLWLSWGVQPAAVAGSGVGQIVAICVAGALDVFQALQLVMGATTVSFGNAVLCPILGAIGQSKICVESSDINQIDLCDVGATSRAAKIRDVAATLKSLSLADVVLELACASGSVELDATETFVISCGTDCASVMTAAAELFVYGCTVDFRQMDSAFAAQSVSLPAPDMNKKRCWIGEEFEPHHAPNYSFNADAVNSASAARRARADAMQGPALNLDSATAFVRDLVATVGESPEPQRLRVVAGAVHELLSSTLPPDQQRELSTVIAVTFADMGLDSNKAKALTRALSSNFGVDLNPTFLFSYPTLQSVAEYFASSLLVEYFPSLRSSMAVGTAPGETNHSPVAVIGMGCVFPGGSQSPQEFWNVLEHSVDCVVEVPASRWSEDLFDPNGAAGKMTTKWGGFLEGPIDMFDPTFFGISQREADAMDPQ
jgi:acyl transferase domain-containing protein